MGVPPPGLPICPDELNFSGDKDQHVCNLLTSYFQLFLAQHLQKAPSSSCLLPISTGLKNVKSERSTMLKLILPTSFSS